MSRINTESIRISDYPPAVAATEVESLAPADQGPEKSEGNRLYRQMQAGMQDFNAFINESNTTIREERLGKSIAGAETVKQGLSQASSQPTADMNTLMLEMNKLLSKMRDLQRDHAIQQQQQSLKMQEKAYDAEKKSIEKTKLAASTNMITGFVGAGVGMVGSSLKMGGSIGKTRVEAQASKLENVMKKGTDDVMSAKLSNYQSKIGHWGGAEASGDVVMQTGSLAAPAGQAASMEDTAESGRLKVGADRDKGLQHLNEREQGIRDDQAREASKQMRDVQSQMNDLYGKIASAVRW